MRSSDTAEIRFDRAPAELLGQRGKGAKSRCRCWIVGGSGSRRWPSASPAPCATPRRRMRLRRRQFARPIGDFQAVQWMLADSAVDFDAAELLVLKAAALEDAGRATSRDASTAKLFASEAATRICNKAVQVLGGQGVHAGLPGGALPEGREDLRDRRRDVGGAAADHRAAGAQGEPRRNRSAVGGGGTRWILLDKPIRVAMVSGGVANLTDAGEPRRFLLAERTHRGDGRIL